MAKLPGIRRYAMKLEQENKRGHTCIRQSFCMVVGGRSRVHKGLK
jgi:hypothetical protein